LAVKSNPKEITLVHNLVIPSDHSTTNVNAVIKSPVVEQAPKNLSESTNYEGKQIQTPNIVVVKTVPQDMMHIPSGFFMMGSNDGEDDEKPVHKVYVDEFFMDKYQVTVSKFKEFIDSTGYITDAEKEGWGWAWTGEDDEQRLGINWRFNAKGDRVKKEEMNHPVVHISWNDAFAYAQWASKRLPTEAEWEYAARCGKKGYKYSWGSERPDGRKGGNIADESLKRMFSKHKIWDSYDDGFVFTAPVGSFEPNDLGLYDMTGNVWEWCADWYDEQYYHESPERNPTGPLTGTRRVFRGGSFLTNPFEVRCSYRTWNYPTSGTYSLGFRCVQDVR
jgi:formylglycine-generating enzyme required for sulfatase activity